MNDNSRRVVDEMKRRKVSRMELALSLGMFDFSLKNRLEKGLTDAETQRILNVLKGGDEE